MRFRINFRNGSRDSFHIIEADSIEQVMQMPCLIVLIDGVLNYVSFDNLQSIQQI